MSRFRFTTIAHARHQTLSPIGAATLIALLKTLDRAGLRRHAALCDIGCGKGELLLQITQRFDGHATGVDPNETFLDDARRRAEELGLERSARWIASERAEADLAAESFDLAMCIGATHAFGGLREALVGLAQLVRREGLILAGEGYWRQRPAQAYLALLGCTEDEFASHESNVSLGESVGLEPIACWESSVDDWDAYEDLYAATMESFLARHPDDPDHAAFSQRIRTWRDGYVAHGRDTLGFGLYLFRRR